MAVTQQDVPPLQAGDSLSLEEFLQRWEAMPNLKRAELIRGVVYMPSPLSREHGVMENRVAGWLFNYVASTPGVEAGNNTTWLMEKDAPQPDTSLLVLPEHGGSMRMKGIYLAGVPEFLTEVCASSASYDLHQKLELYQDAEVREYVAVLVYEKEVRWHRLAGDHYEVVSQSEDGIYRSTVFPGLWLNAPALLAADLAGVLDTLRQGLESPGHQDFVARLVAARKSSE
jgi:Uma2 family endonuclease